MISRALPDVDTRFSTHAGDQITVIGTGTGGIVVEYHDGRVELIAAQNWQQWVNHQVNTTQH